MRETTGQGVFTLSSQSASAQAGYVSATAASTLQGSLAEGPGDRSVYLSTRATMSDAVTITNVIGTPEYLRVWAFAHGTQQVYGFSQVQVSSTVTIGPSQYFTNASCANSECQTANSLSFSGEAPNSVGPGLIPRQWTIPMSAVRLNEDQFLVGVAADLSMNIFMVPKVESDGTTLNGSANAFWGQTTAVGGFQVLDSNFKVLAATFTSESGHDYTQDIATGIPEPGSLVTALLGLIAFTFSERRRRR
jgi:hypothetical protein